jgi:hypothetical protein
MKALEKVEGVEKNGVRPEMTFKPL